MDRPLLTEGGGVWKASVEDGGLDGVAAGWRGWLELLPSALLSEGVRGGVGSLGGEDDDDDDEASLTALLRDGFES